jgi:hypothetical protein
VTGIPGPTAPRNRKRAPAALTGDAGRPGVRGRGMNAALTEAGTVLREIVLDALTDAYRAWQRLYEARTEAAA